MAPAASLLLPMLPQTTSITGGPAQCLHAPSGFHAEDNAQDALDHAEPPRIECEGNIGLATCRPADFQQKPRCGELGQVQPEVPGIGVRLVRLDIADAAVLVLELALNESVH
jgi:hypothetical protein